MSARHHMNKLIVSNLMCSFHYSAPSQGDKQKSTVRSASCAGCELAMLENAGHREGGLFWFEEIAGSWFPALDEVKQHSFALQLVNLTARSEALVSCICPH